MANELSEPPVLWALWTGEDYQRYSPDQPAEGDVITYATSEKARWDAWRRLKKPDYLWVRLTPEIQDAK